jgi:hypothetical protein
MRLPDALDPSERSDHVIHGEILRPPERWTNPDTGKTWLRIWIREEDGTEGYLYTEPPRWQSS